MAKTIAKKMPVKGKTAPATKKEMAKVKEGNVDVSLMMRQDAGMGVSISAEDNIIPLIYILQAQTPQALRQKQEYIKGAVAGHIWPRGSKILIDGDEGMPVILAAVRKFWVEWKPERGQGLVGKHDFVEKDLIHKGRPPDSTMVKDPKTGNNIWVRENGNVLVETREHAVLAFIEDKWSAFVIAMKGSDHKTAREWNGERMRKQLAPPNDDIVTPPAYAFVYTLKTVAKTNDKGNWYGWAYENGMGDGEQTETKDIEGGVELCQMARSLGKAFLAGDKNAELVSDEYEDGDDAVVNEEDEANL